MKRVLRLEKQTENELRKEHFSPSFLIPFKRRAVARFVGCSAVSSNCSCLIGRPGADAIGKQWPHRERKKISYEQP